MPILLTPNSSGVFHSPAKHLRHFAIAATEKKPIYTILIGMVFLLVVSLLPTTEH
uniref:hypothetical protein n=1 Tax=Salmonella sp. TaxID=599 RepID=UPI001CDA4EDB|nr:hypothetical protein [Salmonella sp.]